MFGALFSGLLNIGGAVARGVGGAARAVGGTVARGAGAVTSGIKAGAGVAQSSAASFGVTKGMLGQIAAPLAKYGLSMFLDRGSSYSPGGSPYTPVPYPELPPFGHDVPEYMDDIDPTWRSDMAIQRDVIRDFMKGNIPDEVKGQIEMLSAEKAWQGGFGTSPRAGMLSQRDLGRYSVDLMKEGVRAHADLLDYEFQMSSDRADQAYSEWAVQYKSRLAHAVYQSRLQAASMASEAQRVGSRSSDITDLFGSLSGLFGGGASTDSSEKRTADVGPDGKPLKFGQSWQISPPTKQAELNSWAPSMDTMVSGGYTAGDVRLPHGMTR